MKFSCNLCPKSYTKKQKLNDHLLQNHQINARKRKIAEYNCGSCSQTFTECKNELHHLRWNHRSTKPAKCLYCHTFFAETKHLQSHISGDHKIRGNSKEYSSFQLHFTTEQYATKTFFQSYRVKIREQLDLMTYMELNKSNIQLFVKEKCKEFGPIKVQFSTFAHLIKPIEEKKVSCHASSFAKPFLSFLDDDDFYEMVDQMVSTLQIFCSS